MHLVYIDDSSDEKCAVFSALIIPERQFKTTFSMVKDFRKQLRLRDDIPMQYELHAWKFVSGRGCPRGTSRERRCEIFDETLSFITTLPGVQIINAALARSEKNWAFERLVNRINKNMQVIDDNAILFCDEGDEVGYRKMLRKMSVFNPIRSKFGTWSNSGSKTKNIPLDNIIEDPVFKVSGESYFIQLADFCAYALLRCESQLPSKNRYGLHKSFSKLAPSLVLAANRKDPLGVVR